jgi:hypothetical protein
MAAVAETVKPSSWSVLKLALRNRKTGYMALFGFASGLPFALFLGTLYAWLSEAEVDLETMGVFSLIGLAYAFQFLWSPLVDRLDIPWPAPPRQAQAVDRADAIAARDHPRHACRCSTPRASWAGSACSPGSVPSPARRRTSSSTPGASTSPMTRRRSISFRR